MSSIVLAPIRRGSSRASLSVWSSSRRYRSRARLPKSFWLRLIVLAMSRRAGPVTRIRLTRRNFERTRHALRRRFHRAGWRCSRSGHHQPQPPRLHRARCAVLPAWASLELRGVARAADHLAAPHCPAPSLSARAALSVASDALLSRAHSPSCAESRSASARMCAGWSFSAGM